MSHLVGQTYEAQNLVQCQLLPFHLRGLNEDLNAVCLISLLEHARRREAARAGGGATRAQQQVHSKQPLAPTLAE